MLRSKLAWIASLGLGLAVATGCIDSAPTVNAVVATRAPLQAELTTESRALACGGSTQVSLTLAAGSLERSTPVELMLALDDSGSISGLQFDLMRNALIELVTGATELFQHGGRIGIVLFSGTNEAWPGTTIARGSARLQLSPSDDPAAVIASLRAMTHLGGSTCTICGLDLATEQLQASGSGSKRVTLVITDGTSNSIAVAPPENAVFGPYLRAHLRRAIERAHAADVELFVVGVGDAVNPAELALIADDPDAQHQFEADRFAMLGSALGSIVAAVALPEATAALLTLSINPAFTVTSASADAGDVRLEGQQLRWEHAALRDQSATLHYDVTHRPASFGGDKALLDSVQYSDLEGHTLALPEVDLTVSGCDRDGDSVADETDACVESSDPDQTDTDGDGQGDACEEDDDGDGLADGDDNCPIAANPDQADRDDDGLGDACDATDDSDTDAGTDESAEPDEPPGRDPGEQPDPDEQEAPGDAAMCSAEEALCACEAAHPHPYARLLCARHAVRKMLGEHRVQRWQLPRLWSTLLHARCDK